MKKNLALLTLLFPALFYLNACSEDATGTNSAAQAAAENEDPHEDHDEHEEVGDTGAARPEGETHGDDDEDEGHEEGSDHVELNFEEAESLGIRMAEAESGAMTAQLELPAEIRFDADRVARISSKVEGVVSRLYAGEGDTVEAGARLARLDSRELAGLKAEYLSALSAERLARTTLEREERLWEQKITSEADVQTARADHFAAATARKAAASRLYAAGIDQRALDGLDEAENDALAQAYVTAPIAGRVIRRTISLGETVSTDGEPLFIIVDDSVVWADVAVYKEDLGKVEEGLAVTLQGDDGSVMAEGTIATVLPVINETSRTATARVIVDNPEHELKPGQFVTALIDTGGARSALKVPADAVVSVEDNLSVFVPTGDGFEPREVRTGASEGGYTEIISGLSAGERFVSEGAFTLKAELEKDAFGDGHDH
ncbi:MAG: efflux transporter periplasmic adaptor subunit [Rhodospirillaceae bacterium]|jgi:cobalt-zinc-cadmium efflux system membrane fusion protein|nr:efflux transporter periplasmic adaptor subunit [Rhodospirillaceae bacterium]|tara:strand:- start:378 stop:1670 length:1293 start_codon:yes stop_codon:yes gene_type:complete